MRAKRPLAVFAALLLLLTLSPPLPAKADAVTDTIGVYVGYYGWPESDYREKAAYHWTELDDLYGGALDTNSVIYSYTNGSGRVYMAAARGFYIRDLLQYAGVDFGSVASIDFFTKDHVSGAYRSFTKWSLFDLPRYYFPNLAANEETGEIYAFDGGDLWNGATRVDAMLALEDYTEWLDWPHGAVEFEQAVDWTALTAANRFHLFFGQYEPAEANTSSAAKYCYKILVTFAGTPRLSAEETDMTLKIGSGHRLEIDVDAEDGLLNDYVRENIAWASSDESVVSVSPDGTLTVRAAGDATVTASFGQSSVSVNVHVGAEQNESPGNGTGTGTGAAQPGASEPSAEAEPPQTGAKLDLPTEEPEAVPVPAGPVIAISAEALAGLLQGDAPEDQNGGTMDDDSTQLTLPLPEKQNYVPVVLTASAAALALGAIYEILRFKRLLKGRKP